MCRLLKQTHTHTLVCPHPPAAMLSLCPCSAGLCGGKDIVVISGYVASLAARVFSTDQIYQRAMANWIVARLFQYCSVIQGLVLRLYSALFYTAKRAITVVF